MIAEFKQGIVIGLAVSVPVGPVALLIMRRSLLDGKTAGFVSGVGAATADCICGVIAALGLAALTSVIEHHMPTLRLFAGCVLIVIGVYIMKAKTPLESRRPIHERNLFTAYFSTAGLTLASPMTFLAIMSISAAAGVGTGELSHINTGSLLTGIFIGSTFCWTLLSLSAGWLGKRLGSNVLRVTNLISAGIVIVVGAYQLADVIAAHFW